jgi:hypothetical protein
MSSSLIAARFSDVIWRPNWSILIALRPSALVNSIELTLLCRVKPVPPDLASITYCDDNGIEGSRGKFRTLESLRGNSILLMPADKHR